MSASMRIAKAQFRGDPGIFGSIGKFIGGAVKGGVTGLLTGGNPLSGVIGGVAGGIKALSGNGKPVNPSVTTAARALPAGAINILQSSNLPTLYNPPQLPTQIDSTRTSGVSLFPGGPMVGTQTTYSSPAAGGARAACGSGYHTNKTGYYTRQGYVGPGTKCVRNRKRNPLNPRAASRAMSRLTSAKKASRFLNKIHFGGAPARRAAPAPAGKKGCGCK